MPLCSRALQSRARLALFAAGRRPLCPAWQPAPRPHAVPAPSACFTSLSLLARARTMASDEPATPLRLQNAAVFVCDIQERFAKAIHEFDSMVTSTTKLLTFAKSLDIPIHATTQTQAKLGPTIASLAPLIPSPVLDKTKFSMLIPELANRLRPASHIAIVGIESHVCVTQTALDLRDAGHTPYVIADAVSSCNRTEVIVALDRLRAEPGIVVTTSESWMFECLGDASHPHFKSLFKLVKDSVASTREVLQALPPTSKM